MPITQGGNPFDLNMLAKSLSRSSAADFMSKFNDPNVFMQNDPTTGGISFTGPNQGTPTGFGFNTGVPLAGGGGMQGQAGGASGQNWLSRAGGAVQNYLQTPQALQMFGALTNSLAHPGSPASTVGGFLEGQAQSRLFADYLSKVLANGGQTQNPNNAPVAVPSGLAPELALKGAELGLATQAEPSSQFYKYATGYGTLMSSLANALKAQKPDIQYSVGINPQTNNKEVAQVHDDGTVRWVGIKVPGEVARIVTMPNEKTGEPTLVGLDESGNKVKVIGPDYERPREPKDPLMAERRRQVIGKGVLDQATDLISLTFKDWVTRRRDPLTGEISYEMTESADPAVFAAVVVELARRQKQIDPIVLANVLASYGPLATGANAETVEKVVGKLGLTTSTEDKSSVSGKRGTLEGNRYVPRQ